MYSWSMGFLWIFVVFIVFAGILDLRMMHLIGQLSRKLYHTNIHKYRHYIRIFRGQAGLASLFTLALSRTSSDGLSIFRVVDIFVISQLYTMCYSWNKHLCPCEPHIVSIYLFCIRHIDACVVIILFFVVDLCVHWIIFYRVSHSYYII